MRSLDIYRPCYHYRIYDRDGVLLYSGSACDVPRRLQEHRYLGWGRHWWAQVDRIEQDEYPTVWQALLAERSTGPGKHGKLFAGIGPKMAARMTGDELAIAATHPAYASLRDRDLAEKWRMPVMRIHEIRRGTR
ncbi:MAG: hypothetical protein ACOC9R_02285, partial [bacterium]